MANDSGRLRSAGLRPEPEEVSALRAAVAIATVRCPRCHHTCGWCGDYRHMHGQLKLPGSNKLCDLPPKPEGADCPLCHGDLRVRAITHYERLSA